MITEDEFFEDTYGSIGKMYPNAYIGGWTAAEKLDLLEEGSRHITLFSPAQITEKEIYGIHLETQVLSPEQMFGTTEEESLLGTYRCSDLEKTIVDLMLYPQMFGDKLNQQDILKNYMQRPDKDLQKLQTYFKLIKRPDLIIRVIKGA